MSAKAPDKLRHYRSKRDFRRTLEPAGEHAAQGDGNLFVVQKHAARRLHYDFRLELDGTLKSWAVPKGPSLDPDDKRLAVHVEDHPLDYADFEGVIPAGEYGGGTVIVWDRGTWTAQGDALAAYRKGHLSFTLHGEKLQGRWSLVRMKGRGENQWLLIKSRDAHASEADVLTEQPQSVVSGLDLKAVKEQQTPRDQRGKSRGKTTRNRPPPDPFAPQLATLQAQVPAGERWLHEIKYDGYRLLAIKRGDRVRLLSRNARDWTDRISAVARAVDRLAAQDFILDGELIVQDSHGVSDFQALQSTLSEGRQKPLRYLVFDAPWLNGEDLRKQPLRERKRRLSRLLQKAPQPLHYSDHLEGAGKDFFEEACRSGLEGIISKRADAPYTSGRSRDWLKVKCSQRQEFVIGGYTGPSGSRTGFGALLIGYYEKHALRYAGRVGTGFSETTLKRLAKRLHALERERTPFDNPPRGVEARGVHWCRPELVAEVTFTGWTREGRLRHPSFQGLREDKAATEVHREQPDTVSRVNARSDRRVRHRTYKPADETRIANVHISNADRVLYPAQGTTKGALAEYYAAVGDWILPWVSNRPLTLVRCPRGRAKQCFYQKHLTDALPPPVEGIEIEEQRGTSTYVLIRSLPALITLVQFGTLELHPWPARADRLDCPDMLVFDLDPGEGVSWSRLKQAAREVRDALAEVGLKSFLRTTGGKGLHLVVPLQRRHDWSQLRTFSEAFARAMAERAPRDYLAVATRAKRKGRIYIDYLRNSRGATSVASYSTRARSGAPVAVPLRWDELARLSGSDQYNVENLPRRLAALNADPWEDFEASRQRLPSLD